MSIRGYAYVVDLKKCNQVQGHPEDHMGADPRDDTYASKTSCLRWV